MDCPVENAMEKLIKQETSLELFIDSTDDELAEIMDIVKILKAMNYDGYDFSDELKDLLEDLI